jgi:hypothetical protein
MVTMGPTSSLALSTEHVMTATGAVKDIAGNTMVSPQTSSFTTVAAADTTPPTVTGVTFSNASGLNASKCTLVDIHFSEPLDATTVNGSSVTLIRVASGLTVPVDLRLSDDGQRIVMTPQYSLPALESGTFTANTKGPNGGATGSWTTMSLNVTNVSAAEQALLAVGMTISSGARFQPNTSIAAMNPATSTITIDKLPLQGSGGGQRAFNNSGSAVLESVSSTAGLAVGYALSGTGIPAGATISSIGVNTVTMSAQATAYGTGTVVTFQYPATYRPTVSTSVRDRAGNALASTYNSTTFTAITDATAPTAVILPPAGATVPVNGSFAIYFSEPMDRSTINDINIDYANCNPIINVANDGRSAVVNCINQMTAGASPLTVANGTLRDRYNATDLQSCENGTGNTMAGQTVNFTVSGTDTDPPSVSSVTPADNASSQATSVTPAIVFDEYIDPRTVIPSSVFLMDQQGNLVDAALTIATGGGNAGRQVTITPAAPLQAATVYYVVATTAVRDLLGGNPYDGFGGEQTTGGYTDDPGILRTCFATTGATCP